MELVPFALWSIIVGGISGVAGYSFGVCLLCSKKACVKTWNVVVACSLAITLIVAAWYATCWQINKNSTFDGAMTLYAFLTLLFTPIIAIIVAIVLAKRRKV